MNCPACNDTSPQCGIVMHRHALTFESTDALETHVRENITRRSSEKGYTDDQWLEGLLAWHRQKIRWRLADRAQLEERGLPQPALLGEDDRRARGYFRRYPDEAGVAAVEKRRFFLHVRDCKTPGDLEALARDTLDGSLLALQLRVVRLWRDSNERGAADWNAEAFSSLVAKGFEK